MPAAWPVPPAVQNLFAAWGLQFSPAVTRAFARYVAELQTWNARFNLTAWRTADDIWLHLVADALSLLTVYDLTPGQQAVDVGSGAGIPGVPLHLARPYTSFTLVEAAGKKARFLEHLRTALPAPGLTVLPRRAEEVGQAPAHRERYDLAVARAVAPLPVLLEYVLPLLRVGGVAVAYKGERAPQEIDAAARALDLLGGRVRAIHAIPGLPYTRVLVFVEKHQPTPPRYPRRPGRPRKRPL